MKLDHFQPDATLSAAARMKLRDAGWDGSTRPQWDVENAIQYLSQHNLPIGPPTRGILGSLLGVRVFGDMVSTFRGSRRWWKVSFDVQDIAESTNTGTALYLVGESVGEIVFPVAAVYGCFDAALYLGNDGGAYIYNAMDESNLLVFDSLRSAVDQVVLGQRLSRTVSLVDPDRPFEWSDSELALAGLRKDQVTGRVVSRDPG